VGTIEPDWIEHFRLKREMLRLASDFVGGDKVLLHRYIVTREELEGLSLPVQNELLSAQVETLRDVLSAKKHKEPEPASGDDAPGELRPLAGFSQQPPPAAYSPGPQQAPAAYQQQPADRIYAPAAAGRTFAAAASTPAAAGRISIPAAAVQQGGAYQ
jgi:hypothetical protein